MVSLFCATSSELWGVNHQTGKYPVKVYTIDGVLIYQVDNGGSNTGKTPLGGVLVQDSPSESMAISIANPIIHYGGWSGVVISQDGHSKDLYDYYWSSYSRGTDGSNNSNNWHNVYLDGYIPLRVKSIYDPCPYLYRIPSHGSWNQFRSNQGWTIYSYSGGVNWNINSLGESWFPALGFRYHGTSEFNYIGSVVALFSSCVIDNAHAYAFEFDHSGQVRLNHDGYIRTYEVSVRCIEDATAGVTFVAPKVTKMPLKLIPLGVAPILFCRKKYAKTPNIFSSAPL